MNKKLVEELLKSKDTDENMAMYLSRILIYLQLDRGLPSTRVPCLIGTTQTGKTWFTTRILAPILELPVEYLCLQGRLPEEIVGYPRHLGGDQLTTIKPDWLDTENKKVYFLDELDKAPTESYSALLTFIGEGRVGNWKMAEGSVIIAAMNESNELLDPLKARLVFLPFHYVIRDTDVGAILRDLRGDNRKWAFNPKITPQVESPTALTLLKDNMDILGSLTTVQGAIPTLLEGIIPFESVAKVQSWFEQMVTGINISWSELIRRPIKAAQYIDSVWADKTKTVDLLPSIVAAMKDTKTSKAKAKEFFAGFLGELGIRKWLVVSNRFSEGYDDTKIDFCKDHADFIYAYAEVMKNMCNKELLSVEEGVRKLVKL